METINLLSSEFNTGEEATKVATWLKRIFIASIFALVLVVLVSFIFIAANDSKLSNSVRDINELKARIQTKSSAEQSYYLTKDRVKKAAMVQAAGDAESDIDYVSTSLAVPREGFSIDNLDIAKGTSEFDIRIDNFPSMFSFLDLASNQAFYENARLSNLSFSPTAGFSLEVTFNN